MARPLALIVAEMLDYIEQASSYLAGMTFEQYATSLVAHSSPGPVLPTVSPPNSAMTAAAA